MFEFTPHLSPDLCRRFPNKIFVFGDNLLCRGKAGQAIIREEENSFGVPTKRLPSMEDKAFFSDREDEYSAVRSKLVYLWKKHLEGECIVLPEQKIGSGLANISIHSPRIAELIDNFYLAAKSKLSLSEAVASLSRPDKPHLYFH